MGSSLTKNKDEKNLSKGKAGKPPVMNTKEGEGWQHHVSSSRQKKAIAVHALRDERNIKRRMSFPSGRDSP